ncbi:MAG: NAD(P)/FAD-dependent oxidoreductase [Deltaproteobacteria bacterium]|nr:NAD(P)/FAD-dependent oxidoreductase [Deltaproteobacteria bacterium]
MSDTAHPEDHRPHVVILGGGFAGLTCAQSLARADVRVTLVDRTNHHLFQPLLYQVATAGLSPAEIAAPIRSVLSQQRNAMVILDEVLRIDLKTNTLFLREQTLSFDYVVVAVGAVNNYFGKEAWAEYAPGMKTLDDAVELRRRVLLAFEEAERETDEAQRAALLTMVVIGGGPTGVEMAGALADLSRTVLAKDFRRIDPAKARVLLVEGGERVLSSFPEHLSESAATQLRELGVEIVLGERVTRIDARGVTVAKSGQKERLIPSRTVVWGAGVKASPVTATLGVPLDRGGRVIVERDLSVASHPHVFAIGDCAHFAHDGAPLPGLSPVAMQMARTVAENILRVREGLPGKHFRYKDKGAMATIGRSRAVAKSGPMELTGFVAWLAWIFVHLWFLVGFRNRFVVFFNWAYSYMAYGRGARIITGQRFDAGAPSHASTQDGDMPASSMRAQQVASAPPTDLH